MDTMVALLIVCGLVTILVLCLVFYRSRITKKESDWIPLTDDAKEDQAIEKQKVSEMKSHKLDLPIRVLGGSLGDIAVGGGRVLVVPRNWDPTTDNQIKSNTPDR